MGVIEDKLKLLPTDPGVYVMLDKNGQIIYVGKAKNIKNRVRQYFFNGVKTEKVAAMVKSVADFYYIIAPSEIDALSLENNLIKKHKPRYNILLKDDKTYPYLKISLKDAYPSFSVTRKIKKDGVKYFGPFMGGVNVGGVLDLVNLLYKLRPCDKTLNVKKPIKPCLNYQLKRCSAPCAAFISEEEYSERVAQAIAFLSGDVAEAESLLKEKMLEAARNEEFERALKFKEYLSSLDKIKLKRVTSLNKFINADVLACKDNGVFCVVNALIVRRGIMSGSRNFSFESAALSVADTLSEFIRRFYKDGSDIPDEIIVGEELPDARLLEEFFKTEYDKNITVTVAKQGARKQLADMSAVNAEEHLSIAVNRIMHKNDMTIKACEALKEKLGLSCYPKRMECYDISNISGVDKVGSMVVFIDGEKAASEYRRFRIKSFEGADDFRSLKEVLSRRLDKLIEGDEKFPKPDLIIIDGGKGQLSSVKEIFDEKNITGIDLISLAKREEEIFLPERSDPVVLSKRDYCLKMLQRIRDEAHRFAITYFRTLHGKRSLSSVLDGVKGLGKVKKAALLEKFKDLGGIISADKEELKKVKGIGEKEACAIIEVLTKEGLVKNEV